MSADDLSRLAEEAGFVFRGKGSSHRGHDVELGPAAAGKTIIVSVDEVLRSAEALRGLRGREAIVVSEHRGTFETNEEFVFFTDVVSLGNQLVVRELGHRRATRESLHEVAEALRHAEERPLVERVGGAELIVTGEVTGVRLLEKPFPPRSEHDPDWGVARVAVRSVIKGRKPRGEIEVVFANSDDIAWRHSPKLHRGASGIFVLHLLREDEEPREVSRPLYRATDALDFLPLEQLDRVQRALGQDNGGR
jgi:hypothetical protein